MEPADIDLGEFAPGTPKVVTVQLINESATSIILTAVVPTCGCTVAAWAGQRIEPHGSLAVELTAKPAHEPGRSFDRRCTFHVDGAPPVTCTLRGRVAGSPHAIAEPPHAIRCEPPVFDFGEVSAEGKAMGVVRLVNSSSHPVRFLGIVPPGSGTMPKLSRSIEPGEAIDVPICLLTGPRQGVALAKRWTFQFEDHPPLIYEVRATVASHIDVEPPMLTAGIDAPDSGRVVLRSVDGSAFRIFDAYPPIVLPFDGASRVEHEMRIDWEKWSANGRSVRVAFFVDHPGMDRVSVMIRRKAPALDP